MTSKKTTTAAATEVRRKPSTKTAAKRSISKPDVKASAKRLVAPTFSAKSASGRINSPTPGYSKPHGSVVLVPETMKESKSSSAASKPKAVAASKIRAGITSAQTEIKQSLQDIAAMMSMEFEVSEIELSLSFSANGEFMGFGVGGAASIKVKIKPTSNVA